MPIKGIFYESNIKFKNVNHFLNFKLIFKNFYDFIICSNVAYDFFPTVI